MVAYEDTAPHHNYRGGKNTLGDWVSDTTNGVTNVEGAFIRGGGTKHYCPGGGTKTGPKNQKGWGKAETEPPRKNKYDHTEENRKKEACIADWEQVADADDGQ